MGSGSTVGTQFVGIESRQLRLTRRQFANGYPGSQHSRLPQEPAARNQIKASRQNIPITLAGENVALGALRQKKPTALVLFLLNIFSGLRLTNCPTLST